MSIIAVVEDNRPLLPKRSDNIIPIYRHLKDKKAIDDVLTFGLGTPDRLTFHHDMEFQWTAIWFHNQIGWPRTVLSKTKSKGNLYIWIRMDSPENFKDEGLWTTIQGCRDSYQKHAIT